MCMLYIYIHRGTTPRHTSPPQLGACRDPAGCACRMKLGGPPPRPMEPPRPWKKVICTPCFLPTWQGHQPHQNYQKG